MRSRNERSHHTLAVAPGAADTWAWQQFRAPRARRWRPRTGCWARWTGKPCMLGRAQLVVWGRIARARTWWSAYGPWCCPQRAAFAFTPTRPWVYTLLKWRLSVWRDLVVPGPFSIPQVAGDNGQHPATAWLYVAPRAWLETRLLRYEHLTIYLFIYLLEFLHLLQLWQSWGLQSCITPASVVFREPIWSPEDGWLWGGKT